MRFRSDIGGTVDQLRADIDHRRTGDKVAGSDPAAAPLGADEEAAGTPVSSHRPQPHGFTRLARSARLGPARRAARGSL
jgi:hypothetical protein